MMAAAVSIIETGLIKTSFISTKTNLPAPVKGRQISLFKNRKRNQTCIPGNKGLGALEWKGHGIINKIIIRATNNNQKDLVCFCLSFRFFLPTPPAMVISVMATI